MRAKQTDSPKHVLWTELHEYYYKLGKTVILYQHRPQGESEVACKDRVLKMNSTLLDADYVHILDFPRFTNRYYFIFTRKRHEEAIEALCNLMDTKWKGICEYKDQRYERAGVNDEADEED